MLGHAPGFPLRGYQLGDAEDDTSKTYVDNAVLTLNAAFGL